MPLNIGFMDGAEHYTTQGRKWKGPTNASSPASGVPGAHGLVHDDSVWGQKTTGTTVAATTRSTIRFRIRFRVNTQAVFLNALSGASQHVQLQRNSDGTISVLRPGPASETTTDTYAIDTWFDMEFRLSIGDSGSYLLKVNGSIPAKSGGGVMALSDIDTQLGGDTTMTTWGLGSEVLDTYTDDVVIDLNKNNLGVGQVETAWPSGAGDFAELAPSSIAPNWTLVDEAIGDDLTSYVESAADNQRDCYSFPAVAISGSKFALQACGTVNHGSSGNPTFHFRFFLRIDGENYDGETQHNASLGWSCYFECWSTNPATGDDWTEAEINSAQIGIWCEENDIKLTQLVREVAALTPTPDFAGFRNYCGSIDTDIN